MLKQPRGEGVVYHGCSWTEHCVIVFFDVVYMGAVFQVDTAVLKCVVSCARFSPGCQGVRVSGCLGVRVPGRQFTCVRVFADRARRRGSFESPHFQCQKEKNKYKRIGKEMNEEEKKTAEEKNKAKRIAKTKQRKHDCAILVGMEADTEVSDRAE